MHSPQRTQMVCIDSNDRIHETDNGAHVFELECLNPGMQAARARQLPRAEGATLGDNHLKMTRTLGSSTS